ncbi:helix-turn-helix domain-containing protein [Sediminibacterium goheungense]|uniref:Helix-turn-helix protein n=1 Tax=Sediminibacterium goheungense TaxID=1086393 RepID=A0A4R6IZG1_9BACT|nr:helix-turn-helix domain-containing protein [Sediminibacterium goheungense]TDO28260.1 helix-turn-helix protein [Sediminibacterium goheungense]
MEPITIKTFYKDIFGGVCPEIDKMLDADQGKDIGLFNVFDISQLQPTCAAKAKMPYNRRTYYKISLIKGKNKVEYADRVVEIQEHAILFATPKLPYSYTPYDTHQAGHFCVFTREFLTKSNSGILLDEIPIFKPGSDFVYELSAHQANDFELIFNKMHQEIGSDYPFKYDLLRNYVIELIHNGQKLKPLTASSNHINAASRISSLFIELLERQFPIETQSQVLSLRTAKDYADTLQVHVNHLNKVLKEFTGRTTSEIISSRIAQEAKLLLRQTNWNISEIAMSLGFEEVAHFSNFFKKHSNMSPLHYRDQLFDIYK